MNRETLSQKRQLSTPELHTRENILQRKCACGQHTVTGNTCVACRKKKGMLQRTAVNHQTTPQTAPSIVHDVLRSSGRSLDPATRAYMEPRFGHDFSQVRIHTNAQANESGPSEHIPTLPERNPISVGATCDSDHSEAIRNALSRARNWRQGALRWLNTHRRLIRRRAPHQQGRSRPVGSTIYGQLNLLNRHFGIRNRIRRLGSAYPISANERFEDSDFQSFGQASSPIIRHFQNVDLSGISYLCETNCPKGRRGADVRGSARPGSREFTIYTSCWDHASQPAKTCVVMHEAFHASFSNFDHDSYSFETSYPGSAPITNADSYSTFASIVSLGRSCRVRALPTIQVTGSVT